MLNPTGLRPLLTSTVLPAMPAERGLLTVSLLGAERSLLESFLVGADRQILQAILVGVIGDTIIPGQIAGLIEGHGDLTAAILLERMLTGVVNGQTSLTASISLERALGGAIGGQSSLIGALQRELRLVGNVQGSSVLTGNALLALPGENSLAGNILATSSLAASIQLVKTLAGAMSGSGSLVGALDRTKTLAGGISGSGSAAAASTQLLKTLSSAVIGSGNLVGALQLLSVVAGGINGVANLTGSLQLLKALAGGVSATGTLTGTLEKLKTLVGGVTGSGTLVGALTLTAPGGTPTFRSLTSVTYASRTNTVLTAPAGLANNDILLAAIFTGVNPTAPTPTPPAGFTAIDTPTSVFDDGGFNGKLSLFWKRAASESGSYTFTHSTCSAQGVLIAVSGAITSGSPVDVFSKNSVTFPNTAQSKTTIALSVTTALANDLLFFIAHDWEGTGALSPPSGMTERFDSLIYAADVLQAAAGASGNKTQTNANTSNDNVPWAAYLVAIKG